MLDWSEMQGLNTSKPHIFVGRLLDVFFLVLKATQKETKTEDKHTDIVLKKKTFKFRRP